MNLLRHIRHKAGMDRADFRQTGKSLAALLDRVRRLAATVPLGRIGSEDEVVDAILFMARASYVTGEALTVDGGLQLF